MDPESPAPSRPSQDLRLAAPGERLEVVFAPAPPQVLRPGRPLAGDDPAHQQRRRILNALTYLMAERGYAGATVGEASSRARVSRRTFYEQFTGKEDAFLAAYDLAGNLMLGQLRDDLAHVPDWRQRLVVGLHSYLTAIGSQPAASRVFLTETMSVGPAARARREAMHERWAAMLADEVRRARIADPALAAVTRQLDHDLACAVVVGIERSVLAALQREDDPLGTMQSCLVLITGAVSGITHDFARLLERSGTSPAMRDFIDVRLNRTPRTGEHDQSD